MRANTSYKYNELARPTLFATIYSVVGSEVDQSPQPGRRHTHAFSRLLIVYMYVCSIYSITVVYIVGGKQLRNMMCKINLCSLLPIHVCSCSCALAGDGPFGVGDGGGDDVLREIAIASVVAGSCAAISDGLRDNQ